MVETILSILAACVTIFIAGLLVRKQNKHHETTQELNTKIEHSLKEIEENVILLTNEDLTECTLSYLELRMESLNKCLSIVKNPKFRRDKNVKHKKNLAND